MLDSAMVCTNSYLYFSTANGQPRKPALCQLYRHTTFVACSFYAYASVLVRFVEGSPDGVPFAVICLAVRVVEALGAAALITSSFAIIANTFPDNVTAMFVRTPATVRRRSGWPSGHSGVTRALGASGQKQPSAPPSIFFLGGGEAQK